MTGPGVPVSPGFPPLESAAQQALRAAQMRLEALTMGRMPLPVRQLTEDGTPAALKSARDDVCVLCGALHPAPNTPACPRVATFKCNPDGRITEGTFWPDGITEETVTADAKGEVVSVVRRTRSEWPTDRVIFAADLAEDESDSDEGEPGSGAHLR